MRVAAQPLRLLSIPLQRWIIGVDIDVGALFVLGRLNRSAAAHRFCGVLRVLLIGVGWTVYPPLSRRIGIG